MAEGFMGMFIGEKASSESNMNTIVRTLCVPFAPWDLINIPGKQLTPFSGYSVDSSDLSFYLTSFRMFS